MRIKDFEKRFDHYRPKFQGVTASSAVLVPLIHQKNEPYLLFEVRSDRLRHQPGEVCFPGGKMEENESSVDCALRETEEELSIPAASIRPIAPLDFIYHQAGFVVYPILAEIKANSLKSLSMNKAEVKETFLVPFSFFYENSPMMYSCTISTQPQNDFPYHLIGSENAYPWRTGKMHIPIYLYEGHAIWGLTGRICMNLAKQMHEKKGKNTGAYHRIEHPFPPLYDSNSKILILGSFPSAKSREAMFFYHHPQNRFWKVIAAITGETPPESIEEKRSMLLNHHIALWDVIQSCDIIGSSDSSIKNVVPNDLQSILASANICQIYTNGTTAAKLYRKYIEPKLGQNCIMLPSTSPANAAFSVEKLISIWGEAIRKNL